jgi:positive regulator of sigma E activity
VSAVWQLAFENVLQILGATVVASLLVWVLFKYSQAHNGPQRDDVVTLQELLTRRVKPAVQSRRAKK